MLQPWVLDINMMFIGSTIHVNRVGTFGLSLTHMGYGDMEVTSNGPTEALERNSLQTNLVQV